MAAIKIAAYPPKRINDKKIIESEKLRMNFARGSVKLIRGVSKSVKARINKKLQLKTSFGKYNVATIKQMPPTEMTASL